MFFLSDALKSCNKWQQLKAVPNAFSIDLLFLLPQAEMPPLNIQPP